MANRATVIQTEKIVTSHLGHARDFGLKVPSYYRDYAFEAAYGLHLINPDYAGPALKIRNKTNNAYGDLAFAGADKVVSADSIVTITAAGTSGWSIGQTMTLAAFAGVANVSVFRWYDQSGNGRHLSCWTGDNTQEPTLMTAGVMEVNPDNGLPCITFNGTSNRMEVNATVSVAWIKAQPFNVLAAVKVASSGNYKSIWDHKAQGASASAGYLYAHPDGTANDNRQIGAGVALNDTYDGVNESGKSRVYGARYSGATSQLWVDGVKTVEGNAGSNVAEDFRIGVTYWTGFNANKYQEILVVAGTTLDNAELSQRMMAYHGLA